MKQKSRGTLHLKISILFLTKTHLLHARAAPSRNTHRHHHLYNEPRRPIVASSYISYVDLLVILVVDDPVTIFPVVDQVVEEAIAALVVELRKDRRQPFEVRRVG